MSFPVNQIIVSLATIRPVDGEAPQNVELVFTDPNSATHSVPVTLESTGPGFWTYRGFILPTISGAWSREWSASNLLTNSPKSFTVV